MAIEEDTNIGALAIASLTLSLLLNLFLFGYGIAQESNGVYDNIYPDAVMDLITDKMPDDYVCETGDTECEEQLGNVPTEEQGQIDKSQTLVNVVPIIGGMLVILAMTPLLPSVMAYQIIPMVNNLWVSGLMTLFFGFWQIIIIWSIYTIIFRK